MKTWITRWPFVWAGLALAVIPGLAITAAASSGAPAVSVTAKAVTPDVTGTFRDGPYAATTPDSGSCGNNWAIDLFNRAFVIHPQNTDGTWTVVEKFNAGKFITLGNGGTGSAASPGQCDSAGNSAHQLREGISGTFTGSFTITVDSGFLYTSNQGCGSAEGSSGATTDDGCTTAGWIERAFPGASYGSTANVTAYSLTYHAAGKQWTDANTGDSGDIFTS